MEWSAKFFNELSAAELYEILKARTEIFIVEQQICYQDMDGKDTQSLHCFFNENGKVVAYLRAFYLSETAVKIGRVLTLKHGCGMGRQLLERSLTAIRDTMKCDKICVDAQKHAVGFYEKFGFTVTSGDFMEEGILHQAMELRI